MIAPPSMPASAERRRLRRVMRARRRALDPRALRAAADGLTVSLARGLRGPWPKRIAAYLARDGEIDPAPFARRLARRGCALYLPRIDPLAGGSDRMRFAPWQAGAPMTRNRFGIGEPSTPSTVPAWTLDVVLVPLVAFDRAGGRLGMGGGFYDRTFAALRPTPRRPLLVGVAHALQEVPHVPMAGHDVALDAVATEREFLPLRRRRTGP